MNLTKETERAFKIIYCEYRRLRKAGFTKRDSVTFKSGAIQKIPAFSDWNKLDILSAVSELKSVGYLKANILGDISITDNAIKYMENKPREFFNDISSLFDLVSIFIP